MNPTTPTLSRTQNAPYRREFCSLIRKGKDRFPTSNVKRKGGVR